MGWASDVLVLTELGSRAWAFWSDERMFVTNFLKRHQDGERFHSQIRRGRWVHPMVEMMLQRIEHPEWIWNPERRDPPVPLETIDEITARCAA